MVRVHLWRGVLFDDKHWTGHAALSAGRNLAKPELYISYWPKKGGDQRPGKKGRKLTRSRAGTYQVSLAADVTEIGAPPSNTVDIVGLSEAAMSEFWREVLTGEDKGFQLAGKATTKVLFRRVWLDRRRPRRGRRQADTDREEPPPNAEEVDCRHARRRPGGALRSRR